MKKESTTSAIPLLDALFQKAGIEANTSGKQNWNELDTLYEAIGTGILDIGTQVNDAIRLITTLGITNNAELAISVNGLTRDIEQYTKDLIHIRSHHKDKSGFVVDGADLALSLTLFDDYRGLHERFRANVFPVMLTVSEHLADAVSAHNKAKQESEEQAKLLDPKVISDVEVKVNTNEQ